MRRAVPERAYDSGGNMRAKGPPPPAAYLGSHKEKRMVNEREKVLGLLDGAVLAATDDRQGKAMLYESAKAELRDADVRLEKAADIRDGMVALYEREARSKAKPKAEPPAEASEPKEGG